MTAVVGLVLGFVVSVPPTGAVPMLVLRRAIQGAGGRGLLVALGAVLANAPYVWLGTLGYGWVLDRHPGVGAGLDLLGAAVLAGLGAWLLRSPVDELPPARGVRGTDFLTGLAIGALNASRVLIWTVVASIASAVVGRMHGAAVGWYSAAVTVGAFGWYTLLVGLWRWFGGGASARFRRRLLVGSGVLALAVAGVLLARGVGALAAR
jgi:threonine/homoserine/homoserine lactone efflux protein